MKSERLQIQEKRFNELKINREGLPTQGQGKERIGSRCREGAGR